MQCSNAFTLLAIALCSCAPQIAAPALYPATMAVDFEDDLACLTPETRERMVRGVLRVESDAIKRVIDCNARSRTAEIERDAAQKLVGEERAWALVGKLGVCAAAVGAIIVGVLLVSGSAHGK